MWYPKSVEDTERHFRTDRNSGLTALEHDRRREYHGPNALEQKKQTSPAGLFFRQFADFMVMVLMAAAAVVVGGLPRPQARRSGRPPQGAGEPRGRRPCAPG